MKAADDANEKFYYNLSKVLCSIPASEAIVLLDDFNARVGKGTQEWKVVTGRRSLGNKNTNGELLASICAASGLILPHTMFELFNIHKGNWQHPCSKHWH